MARSVGDLESADYWDYQRAKKRPPVNSGRAVVSVAFARSDFEVVALYAERLGLRTSQFIRDAAIERATDRSEVIAFLWAGGSTGTFMVDKSPGQFTLVTSAPLMDVGEPITA